MCQINARSLTKEGRIDDMYLELCNIHEFDVALSVHNSITVLKRVDLEQSNIEMLWAKIMFKNHNIIICVCYRQPNHLIAEIATF